MLVYTGKFNSLDGEVEIKDEDIEKLATNHNGMLASLKRLAVGDVPVKHYPPLQLDHSTSAKDTVGRLVGDLEVGEHTTPEGKYKALFGKVRILGKENVEKVMDGRWTHVSIGADLESHKITELTITPFPAAADASLLSKNRLQKFEVGDKAKIIRDLQDVDKGTLVKVVEVGRDGKFIWVKTKDGDTFSVHESDIKIQLSADASLLSAARLKVIEKYETVDGVIGEFHVNQLGPNRYEVMHTNNDKMLRPQQCSVGKTEAEAISRAKSYMHQIKSRYKIKLSETRLIS